MIELWQITALSETVAAVSYAFIAGTIGANLAHGDQWRKNVLGVATFTIFAAAAASRLLHASHVAPFPWEDPEVVAAVRVRMEDPLHVAWSITSAAVAAWFYGQRHVLRPLHNLWIWDDLRRRRTSARQLQSDVVAHIELARACLEEGEEEGARLALDRALAGARAIIGETLQVPARHQAGTLRISGGNG